MMTTQITMYLVLLLNVCLLIPLYIFFVKIDIKKQPAFKPILCRERISRGEEKVEVLSSLQQIIFPNNDSCVFRIGRYHCVPK